MLYRLKVYALFQNTSHSDGDDVTKFIFASSIFFEYFFVKGTLFDPLDLQKSLLNILIQSLPTHIY